MILRRNGGIFIAGRVNPAAGFRTVWTGNSIIPIMQSGRQKLTISSTSANDSITGTGAREATVEGLDENLNPLEINYQLNGQTPVDVGDSFAHINSARVTSVGSTGYNEGVVHVGVGTVTSGVPAITFEQIDVRDSVAHTMRYVVPNRKAFHLKRISVSRITDKSFLVDVKRYSRGIWYIIDSFAFQTGDMCHVYDVPLEIGAGDVFAIEVSNDTGSGNPVFVKIFGEEK
jgi:hypothetical protein